MREVTTPYAPLAMTNPRRVEMYNYIQNQTQNHPINALLFFAINPYPPKLQQRQLQKQFQRPDNSSSLKLPISLVPQRLAQAEPALLALPISCSKNVLLTNEEVSFRVSSRHMLPQLPLSDNTLLLTSLRFREASLVGAGEGWRLLHRRRQDIRVWSRRGRLESVC